MKLFLSDLDGTLLNPEHKTDAAILEGMETIRQQGGFVVPCTGRARPMLKELHFPKVPLVCSNGAIVYDEEGNILARHAIDPATINELLETFPDMPFEFCTESEILFPFSRQRAIEAFEDRWKRRGKPRGHADYEKMFSAHRCHVSKEEIAKTPILKINCNRHPGTETSDALEAWIEARPDLVNAPSDAVLFEITNKNATKGQAALDLAAHYGLQAEDLYTFGDGDNDLSMLELTDNSYAPDTAGPNARKTARHLLDGKDPHCVIHKMLELL